MILPESRSDRSGEHDCFRSNQVVSDAVVGIFDSKAQIVVDGLIRKSFYCPVRRVNKCGFLEQWVGFPNCF